MPDWRALVTDPELASMWQCEEMNQLRKEHSAGLLNFKPQISEREHAYHQGILEGLRIAEHFPEKMFKTEENRKVAQIENQERAKFSSLRFFGGK